MYRYEGWDMPHPPATPKDQNEPKQCPTCRNTWKHFQAGDVGTCNDLWHNEPWSGQSPTNQLDSTHPLPSKNDQDLDSTPVEQPTVTNPPKSPDQNRSKDSEATVDQEAQQPTKADTCKACGASLCLTCGECRNMCDGAGGHAEPTKPETATLTDDTLGHLYIMAIKAGKQRNFAAWLKEARKYIPAQPTEIPVASTQPQPEATGPKMPDNIALTCGALDCPERTGGRCRGYDLPNPQSHDKLDELDDIVARYIADGQVYQAGKLTGSELKRRTQVNNRLLIDWRDSNIVKGGDDIREMMLNALSEHLMPMDGSDDTMEQKELERMDFNVVRPLAKKLTAYLDQHTAARVAEARIGIADELWEIGTQLNNKGLEDWHSVKWLWELHDRLTNKKEAEGQNEHINRR